MNQAEFLKQAYLKGFEKAAAEAEGLEKTAVWGSLAKLVPRIGKALLGTSKATGAAAAGGAAGAATKTPGLLGHAGSLFGFGGKGTLGQTLSAPLRPFLGRSGAHQALGFGTFGGAIGAGTAEEGQRMKGFAKGFGLGTLGGAGWQYGQKGSQAIMKGIAGTGGKNVGGIRGALRRVTSAPKAGKPDLSSLSKIYNSGLGPGQTAKLMGARGAFGVGGFGTGMLGSTFVEGQAEKRIPALRQTTPSGVRGALKVPFAAAQTLSRGRLGLTPGAASGATSGATSGAYSGAYR